MRKKIFAAVLALALVLSLTPAAFALGVFADVTNAAVAQNVEVLQLMGVIGGDENGLFRPGSNLTRAEFCKMAIELQGRGDQVVRYRSRTVFPDVRAAHWASGYINLATTASGESMPALMHGNPDGSFAPGRNITYGEAVTVLARALGYTDKDSGGVWPQGYIDLGAACGLTKGLSNDPNGAITRAQAAQLFVNALRCEVKDSAKLYVEALGSVGDETTLRAVDFSNGKLRTADGKEYELGKVLAGTTLVGRKGRVVTKDDKVLTFLPSTGTTGATVSDAAIIVRADGSTDGFDALTGGVTDYTIYKNGVRTTRSALKRWDVATYNAERNILTVCDTRVTVYYENCDPSPSAPTTVTTLGGVAYAVVTTAQQSLSAFKPGQQMVILLTADGRIAGAVETGTASSNAYAYVDGDGKASLICGGAVLSGSVGGTFSEQAGKVGRISQSKTGTAEAKIYISAQTSGTRGTLDVTTRTLGNAKLADNVMIISADGKLLSLGELTEQSIPADRITYVHTNGSDQVDIIVLGDETVKGEIYGRVVITETWVPADPEEGTEGHYTDRQITIYCGSNSTIGPHQTGYTLSTGTFVAAKYNKNGPPYFDYIQPLTKLSNVPASAWVGDTAVVVGGRTYSVPASVICWNRDIRDWFKDLETAKAYGGTMDLYVKDGVVRAIEVRS